MRVAKNPEERRSDLVEAAERLFAEKGYESTSVSDIVRETRVAQGTFYYHFKSKDDVLVAVVKRQVGKLEERIVRRLDAPGFDAAARLREIVRLLIEMAAHGREVIEYIHNDSNALLHHRLMGTTSRMLEKHLTRVIQEGVDAGRFDVRHVPQTAAFLLGGLMQVMHGASGTTDPHELDRIREAFDTALARTLRIVE